jgi:hypothetical protein
MCCHKQKNVSSIHTVQSESTPRGQASNHARPLHAQPAYRIDAPKQQQDEKPHMGLHKPAGPKLPARATNYVKLSRGDGGLTTSRLRAAAATQHPLQEHSAAPQVSAGIRAQRSAMHCCSQQNKNKSLQL